MPRRLFDSLGASLPSLPRILLTLRALLSLLSLVVIVNLIGSSPPARPAWGADHPRGDAPGLVGAPVGGGASELPLPPVPTGPGGRLPPLPVVVESAPPSQEGAVELDRGLTWVRLRAGDAAQPELVVRNGSRVPLTVTLDAVPLRAGDAGRPEPADPPVGGGASPASWVLLPTSRLQLAPSEQARVQPSVLIPPATPSGGYAAGIRALVRPQEGCPECPTARPDQQPTALLSILVVEVVGRQGPPSQPMQAAAELLTRAPSEATAVVRVTSAPGRSRVVSGRLLVHSWWGQQVLEASLAPAVVLGAATREQAVGFHAPAVPGPYRLELDLTTADGEHLAISARAWLWNPLAGLIAVALVGVLLLGILHHRSS